MELKKKDLLEIINGNGELIGQNDIPSTGGDLESAANNTTDYNAKIGQQPFRYDMLGRFGFTLMPFMEGVEKNQEQQKLLDDLAKIMYEKYVESLEYFYKHPQQLKQEYRKKANNDITFETDDEEGKKTDYRWAEKIIKVVQNHFENAFKEPENIDEGKVVEDKMVDKKAEDEISNKSEDGEVREKKIEKIAGLINKLEKKDIDTLINLLERKR